MTEREKKEERQKYARSGGEAFRDKYGKAGYQEIAHKSHEAIKKNDPGFYARFSAAGIHTRQVKKQALIAREVGEIGNNSILSTFTRFLSGKK